MKVFSGNGSIVSQLEDELPESTVYWMLISIVAAIAWMVYILYFNSQIIGLILTIFSNKFVKKGHIKFGM